MPPDNELQRLQDLANIPILNFQFSGALAPRQSMTREEIDRAAEELRLRVQQRAQPRWPNYNMELVDEVETPTTFILKWSHKVDHDIGNGVVARNIIFEKEFASVEDAEKFVRSAYNKDTSDAFALLRGGNRIPVRTYNKSSQLLRGLT